MFSGTHPSRVRLGSAQFGGAINGNFGGGAALQLGAPSPHLSQSYQEWYNRAKKATAAFADLRDNILPRVSDLRARADITEWLGNDYLQDSPQYRWASVMGDISQADTQGIGIYEADRRTKRITKLEAFVEEFGEKIGAAGGLLPTPQPKDDTDRGTTTIIKEGVDIGTPIGIGLGALAVAVIVSAFV